MSTTLLDPQTAKTTADQVIRALMRDRPWPTITMPRFTPRDWPWECDLWTITDRGYAHEFEVKLTRADFFRDAEKHRTVYPKTWVPGPDGGRHIAMQENKHALLGATTCPPRGPVCFWFVTPAGLVTYAEVPTWSGLMQFTEITDPRRKRFTAKTQEFEFTEIHPAPRRHGEKVTQEHRHYLFKTAYHRWKGGSTL